MKAKLLTLLPGMRWIPHDIPAQEGGKIKTKTTSRNPFSSKHVSSKREINHGTLRPRKSTVSLSGADDGRTHAQGQSAFFATLPLEIRKMVYEYVVGAETLHLTLGSKRRYGHFVCEEAGEGSRGRECGCRVLVGGKEGKRLDGGCVGMVVVCRRMYVYNYSISFLLSTTRAKSICAPGTPSLYRISTARTPSPSCIQHICSTSPPRYRPNASRKSALYGYAGPFGRYHIYAADRRSASRIMKTRRIGCVGGV